MKDKINNFQRGKIKTKRMLKMVFEARNTLWKMNNKTIIFVLMETWKLIPVTLMNQQRTIGQRIDLLRKYENIKIKNIKYKKTPIQLIFC